MMSMLLNLLTVFSLLFGLFFMFIGALGLLRLPDIYSRMHAASKCITLGISGMLMASVFHFSRVELAPPPKDNDPIHVASSVVPGSPALVALTKALLVIIFQVVAAPVAAHMLSRAAHLDGAEQYKATLSDELAEDRDAPPPARTDT